MSWTVIYSLFLLVSFSHAGNKALNKEKLYKKHSRSLLVRRALLLWLNKLMNSNIRAFSLSSLCFVIIIEVVKDWSILARVRRGEQRRSGCCCVRAVHVMAPEQRGAAVGSRNWDHRLIALLTPLPWKCSLVASFSADPSSRLGGALLGITPLQCTTQPAPSIVALFPGFGGRW